MSEENVAVVLEAFRRFKPDDIEAWGARLHPDCRSTPVSGWPEPGPFVGRDALVRQFERLVADWAEFEIEKIEAAADSGDWVVVTYTLRTRGAASGVETRIDQAVALRVANGKIIEAHFRWNREEALEAAGLSE